MIFYMLMTLIRSRLQAESCNHSIACKFKIICDSYISHLKETRSCDFCSYVHSMNRTYAYLRNDRKIKFRMVSVQHFINEARSVCGEEEGSKNWSLRNPSDQLVCFGYLPSPGHLERPTSEIGFKPAKWNPCDAQWWEGGQEDLMIHSVKSGR